MMICDSGLLFWGHPVFYPHRSVRHINWDVTK